MSAPAFYRQSALASVVLALGSVLPIRMQFLDSLAALETIVLQGSTHINLSFAAGIETSLLGGSDYGDVVWSVLVNSFESVTTFGTTAFSLDIPITLPSGPEVFSFTTIDATFSRDMTLKTETPVNLNQLFPVNMENAQPIEKENASSDLLSIGPHEADFDASFGAPYCGIAGSLCDTGTYLINKQGKKEVNFPNT